jgi:prephenate dehydratase
MSDPVAYQGVPGAFSEMAVRQAFPGAELLPCPTFEEVFDALRDGRAARAVVPVENTTVGRIAPVWRLLETARVEETAPSVVVPVHLALIAPAGVAFEALRRVRSHPAALGQCGAFFRAHPWLEAVEDFDTAGAAAFVVEERRGDEAALASERAAEVYGGHVLRAAVQDRPDNATRFVVLRQRKA